MEVPWTRNKERVRERYRHEEQVIALVEIWNRKDKVSTSQLGWSKQTTPKLRIDDKSLLHFDWRTAYSDNSELEREILLFISAEVLTERLDLGSIRFIP